MKNFWAVCAILAFFMLIIPITGTGGNLSEQPGDGTSSLSTTDGIFRVLLTSTGSVTEVPDNEYIYGVVAAEVGPSFAVEAMKAQAVASYTYACVVRDQQRKDPSKELNGADISDSSSIHQGYYTVDQMQEKWGDSFEENYNKIKAAVDEVAGEIIVYQGEPILAAFHAISTGKTETSGTVWNTDVPYLASVNSSGDVLSPSYISVVTLTPDELKAKLQEAGVRSFDNDPTKWIGESEKTEAGTVVQIKLGNKKLTGQKVREVLGLRSSAFDVKYENELFTFTVYGFGHCVGMSQYGAEYMAEQGATYQEILKHYYTGVEIISSGQADSSTQTEEGASEPSPTQAEAAA